MSDSGWIEGAKLFLDRVGIPGLIGIPTLVLFAPEALLRRLYLLDARNSHGMLFGLAFLLGFTMLAILVSKWLAKLIVQMGDSTSYFVRLYRNHKIWNRLDHVQQAIMLAAHPDSGDDFATTVAHFSGDSGGQKNVLRELFHLGLLAAPPDYTLSPSFSEYLDFRIQYWKHMNASELASRKLKR